MDKSSRYEKVPIMNLFFVPLLSDAGLIRSTSFGRMMCQLLGGRMKNGLDKGPKAKLNKSSSAGKFYTQIEWLQCDNVLKKEMRLMNINLDYLWQMEQVAKSCAIFRGNDFWASFWKKEKRTSILKGKLEPFEKLTNFGLKSNWLRINPLFELQLPLAKENRSFWRFRFSCPGATASSGQKVDIFWQLSEWTFFELHLSINSTFPASQLQNSFTMKNSLTVIFDKL